MFNNMLQKTLALHLEPHNKARIFFSLLFEIPTASPPLGFSDTRKSKPFTDPCYQSKPSSMHRQKSCYKCGKKVALAAECAVLQAVSSGSMAANAARNAACISAREASTEYCRLLVLNSRN